MYGMTNFDRVGMMPEFVEGVDYYVGYMMTREPFQLDSLVKFHFKKYQRMNYQKKLINFISIEIGLNKIHCGL